MRRDIRRMEMAVDSRPSIVVCHSLPTNWMLPLPMGWAGEKCPPDPSEHGFVYLIGRWVDMGRCIEESCLCRACIQAAVLAVFTVDRVSLAKVAQGIALG